jgi:2-phosphosulfolactate phosphatase
MTSLEVLFSPAEFAALQGRDLSHTVCVVFDVLRATSTMVTALANGATAIIPVEEIVEALAWRERLPEVLLAGERDGFRIPTTLTGSIGFDLGNSPREFTAEKVRGRTIVITTTNGTRALRACAGARTVLVGSFINLRATVEWIQKANPADLLVVCSGTHDQAAYEDVLGAGSLCDLLWTRYSAGRMADSAQMARRLFQLEEADLPTALTRSRNGRRLMDLPELRDDVAFCARRDALELVAELGKDGRVTAGR